MRRRESERKDQALGQVMDAAEAVDGALCALEGVRATLVARIKDARSEGASLQEIGDVMRVSKQRVGQILASEVRSEL